MTKPQFAIWLAFGLAAVFGVQLGTAQDGVFDDFLDSPRLAALAKELKGGNESALTKFWDELQGKGPLIEPVHNDEKSVWITFIWRGNNNTRRVNVQGGPSSGDFADWMNRLANTDLWYRTVQIPKDSRFPYFFQVNRPLRFPPHAEKLPPLAPPQTDPLNPRQTSSSGGSIVEMPDAPPQPWLKPVPGIPRGALREYKLTSDIIRTANPGFDSERQFAVRMLSLIHI